MEEISRINRMFQKLIPEAKLLPAKGDSQKEGWLPLYIHLQDTTGVMKKLLKHYVAESLCGSCYLSEEDFEKVALFIAMVHDIGKATAVFVSKITASLPFCNSRIESYGIKILNSYIQAKATPHALASENILLYYGCPEGIATVVGAHHGVPIEWKDLHSQLLLNEEYPAFWENYYCIDTQRDKWLKIWNSYLNCVKDYIELECLDNLPQINRQAQMLLTGLLIMADWIASNTEWFPLWSLEDFEGQMTASERTEYGWKKFLFTGTWNPYKEYYSETIFKKVFGFMPRKIQSEILNLITNVNTPGIYIIEAPMGCGKTEVALEATEILASKFHKTGMFFGLPTQATANGIFPRIVKWGKQQSEDDFHSIQLAHGSAELNKDYTAIERGTPQIFDGQADDGLIINSWFCGRKQTCLADFVIGTVDQCLMLALKRKHVMLLHLGLSQKVVVIDEVHAYDAYMNCYLDRALSWLGSYQTPVILLSATLPEKRRKELLKAYLNIKKSKDVIYMNKEDEISYPQMTWTDKGVVYQSKLFYDGTHKTIQIKKISERCLINTVNEVVEKGGCIGIIVNTVKRAQNIAEDIRNNCTDNVLLYHAGFIMPDRENIENRILSLVGKKSTNKQRKGLVIIGTQVLEQSLDLDFDLLITDLCPMDLLLQRIGRLHRHEIHDIDRPDIVKFPRCLVMCENDLDEGSKKIYSEWLLTQTLNTLPEEIVLPDDISCLIEKVYEVEDANNNIYFEYYERLVKQKNKAKSYLLGKADSSEGIHGMLSAGVHDQKAEASVRDGISSVEVIVLVKNKNGTVFFLPWQNEGEKISSDKLNDANFCKRIAEQKIRLPAILCQEWNVDKTIDILEDQCRTFVSVWQQSPWLKGELFLLLDDNLSASVNGYQLSYNKNNGLQYEREERIQYG